MTEDLFDIVSSISGNENKITVNRVYMAAMSNDLTKGLFLDELMWHHGRHASKDPDGWFWMVNDRLERNGISRRYREKATKYLKDLGCIETCRRKAGIGPRTHYRIIKSEMIRLLQITIKGQKAEYIDETPEEPEPVLLHVAEQDSVLSHVAEPLCHMSQNVLSHVAEPIYITTETTTENITTESNQSSSETRVDQESNESFDDDDIWFNARLQDILDNFAFHPEIKKLSRKREALTDLSWQFDTWETMIGIKPIEDIIDYMLEDPAGYTTPIGYMKAAVQRKIDAQQNKQNKSGNRRGRSGGGGPRRIPESGYVIPEDFKDIIIG